MPRERPLKPRTLAERAAVARRLQRESLRDQHPRWGDDQLRRDLFIFAAAMDWALRRGKDPLTLILADEQDRRRSQKAVTDGR